MHLHRFPSGWVVQAPAKLNLFFEVLGRRDDGYHEVETLVYPIDLYDTLYFREGRSGQIELQCERVSGVWGPGGFRARRSAGGGRQLGRSRGGVVQAARGAVDGCFAAAGEADSQRGRVRRRLERCGRDVGRGQRRVGGRLVVCPIGPRGRRIGERRAVVLRRGASRLPGSGRAGRAGHGAGDAPSRGGPSARGPVDGGSLPGLPLGWSTSPAAAASGRPSPRGFGRRGAIAVQPSRVGRREAFALDRSGTRRAEASGLSGARDERKRHMLLRALPPRASRAAHGSTFAGQGNRGCLCSPR